MLGRSHQRSHRFARTALLWGAVFSCAHATEIRWLPVDRPNAIEVKGLTPEQLAAAARLSPDNAAWAATFSVFAEQGDAQNLPPMAGTWSVTGDYLRFEPRYPLSQGVQYRAELHTDGAAPVVSRFELPATPTTPPSTVLQVYPTADTLPENLLKFYVHFSAPMGRGRAYQQIHVRDAAGKVIDLAFLELAEELWDPAMTRLTLLIDPGRIKRGVKPLVDIGPVFEAGKTYSLTIDPECRDATGRPLAAAFEKKFRIGPADRTPPDLAKWKLAAPIAAGRAPLVVDFDESMDQALATRLLDVLGPDGRAIDGEETLSAQERRWTFIPAKPWQAGPHRLAIGTTLEDLAGNNPGKPFDVDLFEKVDRKIETPTVDLKFNVK